jgi:hypothetical protein
MLNIELDKPGKYPPHNPPHWLLEHGRAWLRWYRDQQRQEKCHAALMREARAFARKHGEVVSCEPLGGVQRDLFDTKF